MESPSLSSYCRQVESVLYAAAHEPYSFHLEVDGLHVNSVPVPDEVLPALKAGSDWDNVLDKLGGDLAVSREYLKDRERVFENLAGAS